ncbi:MAG: porin family protein [Bacteroidaceae bacterium]|nr:porin family protein [Bacteroidaceae bacterium]
MKKIIFSLALCAVALTASAQKGNKYFGGGLVFGSETQSTGINLKGQHYFAPKWRGEIGFTNFFASRGVSMWEIYANVHYVHPIAPRLNIYPAAGLGFSSWSFANSDHRSSDLGINLGAGIEYEFSSRWVGQMEFRFIGGGHSQAAFHLGVAYRFD